MIHMVFSSAVPTNSLHVFCFARFIIRLNSFLFFFHSMQSMLLLVLRCMFLSRFSSFLAFVSSSFHHLLLKGDGFFRGVVSAIALLIAFVISVAKLSIASSVVSVLRSGEGGRYSSSLVFSVFQSVLAKLYGGCVGIVIRGVRSRIVLIGRWSEPWLFSVAT